MKQETYSEIRGTVRIHENVIATIVRKMACSVKGVSKISGSSFVDNIAEMVGSKKIHDRSIVVEMGESSVSVEVSINLYYGVSLPQVASGNWKRVLFVPTGAMLSKVSYNEGASVPGIAHGIVIEHADFPCRKSNGCTDI